MPQYSIRVELHNATGSHYERLAGYLRNNLVTDVITGDNGIRYKMSPGEYNYSGPSEFDQTYTAVVTCAAMIGTPYSVTMAQVVSWKWVGLERL